MTSDQAGSTSIPAAAGSASAGSAVGTRIGRYEVTGELGRGAMGVVYSATDPKLGRRVALKVLQAVQGVSPQDFEEFRSRFFREARTAGMLSHPNIVVVHDVDHDEQQGISFMAMELLKGKTVYDHLKEGVRFTRDQTIDICVQVAEGLDHAHRQGVVHRDVKPANLMLLEDGTVKITDFGIAKIATSNLTRSGQFLGTPNYMSPEQVIGHVVDGRSDLFSLGIILYEMLTGEKPFMGSSLTTITYQIVNVNPIEPSKINPQVPRVFDQIVGKLLRKVPEERYQSGKEVAEALRAARDAVAGAGAPGSGTSPPTAIRTSGPAAAEATRISPVAPSGEPTAASAAAAGYMRTAQPRRRWLPLVGGGSVVVGVLAVAVVAALLGGDSPDAPPAPADARPAAGTTGADPPPPAPATAAAPAIEPAQPKAATPSPPAVEPPRSPASAGGSSATPPAPPRSGPPPAPRSAPLTLSAQGAPAVVDPGTTPAPAPPPAAPPASDAGRTTVRLVLEHELKDGAISVALDGRQVARYTFQADKKKGGTTSDSFEIGDGRYTVEVCLEADELPAGRMCVHRQQAFVMNRTATIRANHQRFLKAPHKFWITIE
jgi:serine/threonine-protein kinase